MQMGLLARAVFEKTAGLPLYVDQMVAHLLVQVHRSALTFRDRLNCTYVRHRYPPRPHGIVVMETGKVLRSCLAMMTRARLMRSQSVWRSQWRRPPPS